MEDAGDGTEADETEHDAPPAACPAPIAEACPEDAGYPPYSPYPPRELPVLLRAADFGAGARFVNLGNWLPVLAEREDGGLRTVLAIAMYDDLPEGEVCAELVLPSGSTLRPIDAVSRPGGSGGTALPDIVVLLCDTPSCALYGADLGSGGAVELAPLAGGELSPTTREPTGLWWDLGPAVCAYGDGVHCFDGTAWSSPVVADAARPLFRDMVSCSSGAAMAVGDDRLTARSGWPAWSVDHGRPGRDLLAVACSGDTFLRAGSDGAIEDDAGTPCDVVDEAIVYLDGGYPEWGNDLLLGVTASGRVFIGEGPWSAGSAACVTGQTLGPPPAGRAGYCGSSYYHHLLTAAVAYGSETSARE